MKRGATDHPKMIELADTLGVPSYVAVGIMESLWHWVTKYAIHGNIGKHSNRAIARGIGWEDDPERLVNALVDTKWLDKSEQHRLLVHDWAEHSDDATHNIIARKAELFADGSFPRFNRLSIEERKSISNLYQERHGIDINGVAKINRKEHGERTESALEAHGERTASARNTQSHSHSHSLKPEPIAMPVPEPLENTIAANAATVKKPKEKKVVIDQLIDYPKLNEFFHPLLSMLREYHPNIRTIPPPTDPRFITWRNELASLVRLDQFSEDDVINCLTWLFTEYTTQENGFDWRDQVQSIPALRNRKSANVASKFENICTAWRKSQRACSSGSSLWPRPVSKGRF